MSNKFIQNILKTLNVLYIDTDENYTQKMSQALEIKVYSVFTAKTIKEATEIYNNENIDIIITELSLNKTLTTKFISKIRDINKYIPIIIISLVKDLNLMREVIKLNLTDYIFKPIDIKILKETLMRSATSIYDAGIYEIIFQNSTKYNVRKKLLTLDKDALTLDKEKLAITVNKEELTLTINEVRLLDILIFNQQSLLTKEDLKNMIWENAYEISDEALKSLMTRLRKKIGKESIQNVSGSGYILNLEKVSD